MLGLHSFEGKSWLQLLFLYMGRVFSNSSTTLLHPMILLPLKHRTSCHLLWCLYKLLVKRKAHFYFSIIIIKYIIMKRPERRKIIGENIFPWEVKNHAYSSPLRLRLLPEPPKCLHHIPGLWINAGKWLFLPEGHGWAKIRVLSWVRGVIYRWSPTLVWCDHFLQHCGGCLLLSKVLKPVAWAGGKARGPQ